MTRRGELDALRGLMLVLMTLSHLPTALSGMFGQPFGYVSAAEGFVALSGFFAGMVYSRRQLRYGTSSMRSALQRRAALTYSCHVVLLLFLFTVIAALGLTIDQPAVTNLLSFYLEQPVAALLGGMLLVYKPPLFDILPMYVVFLLLTPALLARGECHGWRAILVGSFALWLIAQFGIGGALYELFASSTGLPVPAEATGAFSPMAWQLLWVCGLWLGASVTTERFPTIPDGLVAGAILIALLGLAWRHIVGQTPMPDWPAANLLFDKWQLAPLRMLNVAALAIVIMRFGPALAARAPRIAFLETLGAAALPVFCAHIVLTLLLLALIGSDVPRTLWFDAALLGVSFALLHAVASISLAMRARPGTMEASTR